MLHTQYVRTIGINVARAKFVGEGEGGTEDEQRQELEQFEIIDCCVSTVYVLRA